MKSIKAISLIFLLGSLAASSSIASSQTAHDRYHWWYKDLRSPAGGTCCNDQDCGTTNFRTYNGKMQVVIHGKWCDVDEEAVLKRTIAPDRGTHVCAPVKPIEGYECFHYCVVIGTGA